MTLNNRICFNVFFFCEINKMSFSLQGSVRTCKVDTAWANRIQTDRFFNPDNMICPVWNGLDTYGRPVQADSFNTKNGGCNSAADRVVVENAVFRPQYFEYVTLDAAGLNGGMHDNMHVTDQLNVSADTRNMHRITGNAGYDLKGSISNTCGVNRYDQAQAQNADMRQQQAMREGYRSFANQSYSGMNY